MSALRRIRRRVAREAKRHGVDQRRILEAFDRSATGCAKAHTPATQAEVAGRDRVLQTVTSQLDELLAIARDLQIVNPVICVIVPDADDREMHRALIPLAEARGDRAAVQWLKNTAASDITLMVNERRDVIDQISHHRKTWSDDSWELLCHPPNVGHTVLYDGTACGHGVVQVGTTNAPGGVA